MESRAREVATGPQEREPGPPKKYDMDYIPDKTVFIAVMFARSMIRQGTSPGLAIHRAADHYDVDRSEVARYVGQAAQAAKRRKRR